MSFSYNIGDSLDISSNMRLEIGDQFIDPDGLLPRGKNFSNEELDHFYAQESDDFWAAIARAFEAAAASWSAYPSEVRLGPQSQKMTAAQWFTDKAKAIRTAHKKPSSASVSRVDYALDVDAYT